MKWVSYNVRLGVDSSYAALGQWLADQCPDVVAVQEVGRFWSMGECTDGPQQLALACGCKHLIHAPALYADNERQGTYGTALLSKTPFQDVEVLPLPKLKDEPRKLIRAVLATPHGPTCIYATHLSWLESDRPAQFEFLQKRMQGESLPVVLLGDLNEDAAMAPIQALAQRWQDCGARDARPTFPCADPKMRLDYVFMPSTWTTRYGGGKVVLSDHFPVIVDSYV